MAYKDLSGSDRDTYRSIIFHGKNSMRDMNLMMIGSTPLSEVTPKIVREEVAYADGDLDLSRIDGEIYFEPRTITYTFAIVDEYGLNVKQTNRNKRMTGKQTDIYNWLFKEYVDYEIPRNEMVDIAGPLGESIIGHVYSTEMFDYAYGTYKFTNASVTEVKMSKAMFEDAWVETIQVTFTCDPYMQTFGGERIELATFVDRAVTARNVQTAMMIYTNNRYYINDFTHWFWDDCGTHVSDTVWRFRIRVPYSGPIGLRIDHAPTWNGVTYTISSIRGQTTPLYFLDNDHPGQTSSTSSGGYCYTTPTTDANGYKIIDFSVTFEDAWTVENPAHIYIEWGVLRNFTVPNQNNYYMDAYTKDQSAEMYVNGTLTPFSTRFILQDRPLNEIHIRNYNYDGLYKLRFDTTSRRL